VEVRTFRAHVPIVDLNDFPEQITGAAAVVICHGDLIAYRERLAPGKILPGLLAWAKWESAKAWVSRSAVSLIAFA